MNSLLVAAIVYLVLNIIAASMFVYDKNRAIKQKRRVPEFTLLLLAFFGPFGAVAAMEGAHHKTQKTKFKLVYVFLVLHVAIIIAVIAHRIGLIG